AWTPISGRPALMAPPRPVSQRLFWNASEMGVMAMLEAFSLELSLWEILARGTIIYLAIAVIIRFIPKRHTGSMSPNDIIALVLVGDLAGYAMVGETTSAPDVLLMIVVVLVWSSLFNVLEYYFPRLRSIDQHSPTLLIHNGQLLKANLAKEKLTGSSAWSEKINPRTSSRLDFVCLWQKNSYRLKYSN